jgi:hypothetical protein
MRPQSSVRINRLATAQSVLVLAVCAGFARADDSGLFGRLFRMGGNGPSPSQSTPSQSSPYGPGVAASAVPSSTAANPGLGAAAPAGGGFQQNLPLSTPAGAGGPAQRVSPRPRVSRAVTSADPLVLRLALGRSNDGGQFAMFMQVFADGTVIDSEGVHHLRPADLRPIVETVQSGELFKTRGHCGQSSTDFVEYVHMVVYERRFGRLAANSFSFSGNTQGCDHAVRHLHTLLDNVQAKLSGQAAAASSATAGSTAPVPIGSTPGFSPETPRGAASGGSSSYSTGQPALPAATNPASPYPSGPVIPLTPSEPSRP